MKKLLPIIILLFYSVSAISQIKPDTTITATDTLISFYSVKPRFDTIVTVSFDTTKVVVVKKVIKPSPYVRQNLLFDFTAENADALIVFGVNLLHNYNSIGKCCVYSAIRSKDCARTGDWSIRYELNKSDPDIYKSKRTEAARASNDEPTLAERWYGASYYPKDWVKDPSPELVTQWQSLKGISPPLALWSNNGVWELVLFGINHKPLGVLESDKWTDFVFHVKWSVGSDGLIEVWKNGQIVLSFRGPNSYAGYITGNYEKNGIYKWQWKSDPNNSKTTKRVIYIDDVRIGNDKSQYKDVAP